MSTTTTTTTGRRSTTVLGLLVAGSLFVAACGDDPAPLAAAAGAESAAAPAADQPTSSAGPAVTAAATPLGDVLVGEGGLTVYGFENDVDGTSACYGTCADAWPPLLVGEDWDVAPGLDAGIFNAVRRDDGTLQLVAGKWPLYYFAGDAVPGDVNGQGSGDVWFAVAPDGVLVTDAAPAAATAAPAEGLAVAADTELGATLVDGDGLTLYGFLDDVDARPTCFDACADAWPPLAVDSPRLPSDLDPDVFTLAELPDGRFQVVAGVWPLYRFAGDAAPGDVNGQGSGDVWFAVAPDGSLLGAGGAPSDTGTGSTDESGGTYDY